MKTKNTNTKIDEFEPDFFPINLASRTLLSAIYGLDDKLKFLEDDSKRLKEELKEMTDNYYKEVNKQHQHSQWMMGQTLLACIGIPSIESLGTVGATMIAKIRDMGTIEQVHEYINEIAAGAKEELTEKEVSHEL